MPNLTDRYEMYLGKLKIKIKITQPVNATGDVEIRPHYPIYQDSVSEVLRAPLGVHPRAVANVGKVDRPIGPELQVLDHERDLEHSRCEDPRQILLLSRSKHVQSRQPHQHIQPGDTHHVVVIPEHGRFLLVRVRVILCCVRWSDVTKRWRGKPCVWVAIVGALRLGAV